MVCYEYIRENKTFKHYPKNDIVINNLFIFSVSLFLVIKGATIATVYAARLAEGFRLSKYAVGFIIVAVISILPETLISINAAVEGIPSFGLATLFGSNVADLTLVFAAVVFMAGRRLKVEGKIISHHRAYPLLLLLPLVLGLDGHYSRLEGVALIIAGGAFYYLALRNGSADRTVPENGSNHRFKNFILLLAGMALLLAGSHFTVTSAVALAQAAGVNPVLIGMLIVGLGTTMPELFFSLKSVRMKDDSLAVGDILGTVLADGTVVVGVLALISPFSFPPRIVYLTGGFMVIASFILLHFMRTGRSLSKREAYALCAFWLAFVIVEFLANR